MYEVSVKSSFSAAHHLRGYQGKCETVHGHNWEVEAVVEGENLDACGLLIDFRTLKQRLNALLDEMDHSDLNEIENFRLGNPTSEHIARYIYERLSPELDGEHYHVARVSVAETPGSIATYRARTGRP
jgi:6-pyruvoyltetrahydropterin/6-carboxytetrahydropterin synthase